MGLHAPSNNVGSSVSRYERATIEPDLPANLPRGITRLPMIVFREA